MKKEYIKINHIPVIVWNKKSEYIYLFVHGKGGSKESARYLAEEVESKNIQVISFDLPESGDRVHSKERLDIFEGIKELEIIYQYVKNQYKHIYLCANSLGAYFALQTYANYPIEKCLFYSPVVDMEYLVKQMMLWFHVSLEKLQEEKEINTPVDPLRLDYYEYIMSHPITSWKIPTSILYGDLDNLQSLACIERFIEKFNVDLMVAKNCEHALMKDHEVQILKEWLKQYA